LRDSPRLRPRFGPDGRAPPDAGPSPSGGSIRSEVSAISATGGRVRSERFEAKWLSPRACASARSKGRLRPEEPCPVRTAFQRDRDRIIHSKAFRRLMHKTQVFISPEGDHYRTRLTHTLEVAQISRTVARALSLNEDLTEAIALGHDLGHTPFGHTGEDVLDELCPGGFRHNEQSLRVVDVLERPGGLNLTHEVRDGILNHTGDDVPYTLEGQVVRICDRVAYVNHDVDDAIRGGIISPDDLPARCTDVLGKAHRQRIDTMVRDLIAASSDLSRIRMSPSVWRATDELREFLFRTVYVDSVAKEKQGEARRIVRDLFHLFVERPSLLPDGPWLASDDAARKAADYVAGMTDRYATMRHAELVRGRI